MAFIKVLKKDDLPVGMLRELQVEGTAITLANVAGTFYAIDNICLHRGGPLSEGELMGNSVTCPWHGWQYDITTGQSLMNPAAGLRTFRVEVRGEEVYVDIDRAGGELPS